jgi:ATP:cob(I)alamin adenosyltransferase
MPKVYTRTGDKGTTTLYNGTRISKDDGVFEALGNIDELAAQLGVALCAIYDAKLPRTDVIATELEALQQTLIRVGSCVATPLRTTSESRLKHRPVWTPEQVTQLEQCIDRMHATLPPLRTFVLPGGWSDDREHVCYTAAYLHVCRVVCRRAERSIVPLWKDDDVEDALMHYMNRLSDYLFTAARFVLHVFNEQVGGEERRNAIATA